MALSSIISLKFIIQSLIMVFTALPMISANVDCGGKAFHCVNSTHFMICVDLGGGVTKTIESFIIPCPVSTECRRTNRYECEFPKTVILESVTAMSAPDVSEFPLVTTSITEAAASGSSATVFSQTVTGSNEPSETELFKVTTDISVVDKTETFKAPIDNSEPRTTKYSHISINPLNNNTEVFQSLTEKIPSNTDIFQVPLDTSVINTSELLQGSFDFTTPITAEILESLSGTKKSEFSQKSDVHQSDIIQEVVEITAPITTEIFQNLRDKSLPNKSESFDGSTDSTDNVTIRIGLNKDPTEASVPTTTEFVKISNLSNLPKEIPISVKNGSEFLQYPIDATVQITANILEATNNNTIQNKPDLSQTSNGTNISYQSQLFLNSTSKNIFNKTEILETSTDSRVINKFDVIQVPVENSASFTTEMYYDPNKIEHLVTTVATVDSTVFNKFMPFETTVPELFQSSINVSTPNETEVLEPSIDSEVLNKSDVFQKQDGITELTENNRISTDANISYETKPTVVSTDSYNYEGPMRTTPIIPESFKISIDANASSKTQQFQILTDSAKFIKTVFPQNRDKIGTLTTTEKTHGTTDMTTVNKTGVIEDYRVLNEAVFVQEVLTHSPTKSYFSAPEILVQQPNPILIKNSESFSTTSTSVKILENDEFKNFYQTTTEMSNSNNPVLIEEAFEITTPFTVNNLEPSRETNILTITESFQESSDTKFINTLTIYNTTTSPQSPTVSSLGEVPSVVTNTNVLSLEQKEEQIPLSTFSINSYYLSAIITEATNFNDKTRQNLTENVDIKLLDMKNVLNGSIDELDSIKSDIKISAINNAPIDSTTYDTTESYLTTLPSQKLTTLPSQELTTLPSQELNTESFLNKHIETKLIEVNSSTVDENVFAVHTPPTSPIKDYSYNYTELVGNNIISMEKFTTSSYNTFVSENVLNAEERTVHNKTNLGEITYRNNVKSEESKQSPIGIMSKDVETTESSHVLANEIMPKTMNNSATLDLGREDPVAVNSQHDSITRLTQPISSTEPQLEIQKHSTVNDETNLSTSDLYSNISQRHPESTVLNDKLPTTINKNVTLDLGHEEPVAVNSEHDPTTRLSQPISSSEPHLKFQKDSTVNDENNLSTSDFYLNISQTHSESTVLNDTLPTMINKNATLDLGREDPVAVNSVHDSITRLTQRISSPEPQLEFQKDSTVNDETNLSTLDFYLNISQTHPESTVLNDTLPKKINKNVTLDLGHEDPVAVNSEHDSTTRITQPILSPEPQVKSQNDSTVNDVTNLSTSDLYSNISQRHPESTVLNDAFTINVSKINMLQDTPNYSTKITKTPEEGIDSLQNISSLPVVDDQSKSSNTTTETLEATTAKAQPQVMSPADKNVYQTRSNVVYSVSDSAPTGIVNSITVTTAVKNQELKTESSILENTTDINYFGETLLSSNFTTEKTISESIYGNNHDFVTTPSINKNYSKTDFVTFAGKTTTSTGTDLKQFTDQTTASLNIPDTILSLLPEENVVKNIDLHNNITIEKNSINLLLKDPANETLVKELTLETLTRPYGILHDTLRNTSVHQDVTAVYDLNINNFSVTTDSVVTATNAKVGVDTISTKSLNFATSTSNPLVKITQNNMQTTNINNMSPKELVKLTDLNETSNVAVQSIQSDMLNKTIKRPSTRMVNKLVGFTSATDDQALGANRGLKSEADSGKNNTSILFSKYNASDNTFVINLSTKNKDSVSRNPQVAQDVTVQSQIYVKKTKNANNDTLAQTDSTVKLENDRIRSNAVVIPFANKTLHVFDIKEHFAGNIHNKPSALHKIFVHSNTFNIKKNENSTSEILTASSSQISNITKTKTYIVKDVLNPISSMFNISKHFGMVNKSIDKNIDNNSTGDYSNYWNNPSHTTHNYFTIGPKTHKTEYNITLTTSRLPEHTAQHRNQDKPLLTKNERNTGGGLRSKILPSNINNNSSNSTLLIDSLRVVSTPIYSRQPVLTTPIYSGVLQATTVRKDIAQLNRTQRTTVDNKNNNITTTRKTTQVSGTVNTARTIVSFNCRNRNRGRYSDPSDCNKFYVCIGKLEPIIARCPVHTVFSDLKKQCTNNKSHCIRGSEFKCITAGRFSDILKQNVYYICVKRNAHFIRYKFQCQNGYYLNKTSVKCIEVPDLEMQSQTSISTDNSKSEISNNENIKLINEASKTRHSRRSGEDFECEEEGKFADENDCRHYYICTKNNKSVFRRRKKKCDSDELFHKDQKHCVDAESYEC